MTAVAAGQLDLFTPAEPVPVLSEREQQLVADLRATVAWWLACAVAPCLPLPGGGDPDTPADPETRRLWWKHAGQVLDEVHRIETHAPDDGSRPLWLTEMCR